MNKVILIGNLTRDPEFTTTQSGVSLTKLSIAVNRAFKNAQGESEVDYFNITAWRGLAENCSKYLSKGNKIAVSGSIQVRNYDDKEGNKRTAVDIVAEDIQFLTPKNQAENNAPSPQNSSKASTKNNASDVELVPADDDDLPF